MQSRGMWLCAFLLVFILSCLLAFLLSRMVCATETERALDMLFSYEIETAQYCNGNEKSSRCVIFSYEIETALHFCLVSRTVQRYHQQPSEKSRFLRIYILLLHYITCFIYMLLRYHLHSTLPAQYKFRFRKCPVQKHSLCLYIPPYIISSQYLSLKSVILFLPSVITSLCLCASVPVTQRYMLFILVLIHLYHIISYHIKNEYTESFPKIILPCQRSSYTLLAHNLDVTQLRTCIYLYLAPVLLLLLLLLMLL